MRSSYFLRLHNLPFRFIEDPIVMRNDERVLTSFAEERSQFSIDEACRLLSMDAVRISRTLERLGMTFLEEEL